MKYFSLTILVLLFFITTALSQSKFNLGASFNVNFPVGSFNDIAKTGVGGSIIGEYPEERFHIIGKARSLENCIWFCCVNFGGTQDGIAYSGASVIIDNTGHIQKVASTGPESCRRG